MSNLNYHKNVFERYIERPDANRKMKNLAYAALAISIVLGIIIQIVYHPHGHFSFENVPAFYAIFGFIACAMLLIGSKWIGKRGLMVREDYYSKDYADYFVKDEKDEERIDAIMNSVKDNRKEVPQ
ncbi:MAG: hypothetical protein MSIBF_01845 [Candidatus Altiarchaeales archaeon IMC4]|nr:MAG: hypothetical protein MSIBF_01845 [Candidatus Altiarchaeales archaeon IMC4]